MRAIYAGQLETPEAALALEQALAEAAARPSALLCYEREAPGLPPLDAGAADGRARRVRGRGPVDGDHAGSIKHVIPAKAGTHDVDVETRGCLRTRAGPGLRRDDGQAR